MSAFIKQVLLFFLATLALMFLLVFTNASLIKSQKHRVGENINKIVIGDSNSECAFNDSILTTYRNYSSASESYLYGYLKLKMLLPENPQIDTILISFSPHNIYDNDWLHNPLIIKKKLPMYYAYMEVSDFTNLFWEAPEATLKAVGKTGKSFVNNVLSSLKGEQLYRYGGYKHLDRYVLDEAREQLAIGENSPFFNMPGNLNVSEMEVHYLEKIITLCDEQKVVPILINTPKREEILSYDKYGADKFENVYDQLFPDTYFIDLSGMSIPETYYADLVHLNYKGAKVFSNELKQNGLKKYLTSGS